ncbi:MAG: hypothetical protein IK059_01185, partial [Firmicutes bacterium]|nr:hypothetical protein [Bacillota bacterium]
MQTTMKSAKRVLSFLLIFALVVGTAFTGGFVKMGVGAEVYASSYPSVEVTIASTVDGEFLSILNGTNVSGNLAESYGYTEIGEIPATEGVSLADVLVKVHAD